MFKMFAFILCQLLTVVSVINCQTTLPMTLPPMETLPPDNGNSSFTPLISPFDESCMGTDNSTDGDGVVYLGAVALDSNNECQVVCQKQVLQQFNIIYAGMIRIRALIVGNVFMASMPDNSTCAQNGTCSGGMCSVNLLNSTGMPETTTMMMNTTQPIVGNSTQMTNSTTNGTAV